MAAFFDFLSNLVHLPPETLALLVSLSAIALAAFAIHHGRGRR